MACLRRYGLLCLCGLLLAPATADAAGVKRPPLTWYRGDGNYTKASRGPGAIRYLVVHATEGRFWGSVGWLQNQRAEASANYVVSRAGTIVQLVHLSDIAWHSGNARMNRESVGIEHTGITDDPAGFTMREYRASAQLAAWLCRRSLIPIDRQHIIGHSEVPGADHTDPGRYWNWRLYLKLVRSYAYPKPFKKLRVRSAPVYDGQVVAGNVPWKAVTTGPKATRVDFLLDGKLRWADRRAPFAFAGGRPLKTLGLRNGRHTLRVVAFGRSGHSAAHTISLRVQNRRLELTTAGLRRHQKVAGLVKLKAATTVPTPSLRVYVDGRLVRRVEKKPYAVTIDLRTTVNGRHTLDLRTSDVLGRTATRRIPFVVANPAPPQPAQLVAQSLVDGQVVGGTVPWSVTVTGAVARVDFLVDGAVRATATAAPYAVGWDTAADAPGPHTLAVRLTGTNGAATQSTPITVTIPAPAPAPATALRSDEVAGG
jgi:hypothetical protein